MTVPVHVPPPRGVGASEAVIGVSVWEEGEASGPHPHVLSRSRKGAGPPGPHLAPSATDPVSHQLKIARVRAWGTPTSPSLICHLLNPSPLCPFQCPTPLPKQLLRSRQPFAPTQYSTNPTHCLSPALLSSLYPTVPPNTLSQPCSQHPACFPTTSCPCPPHPSVQVSNTQPQPCPSQHLTPGLTATSQHSTPSLCSSPSDTVP